MKRAEAKEGGARTHRTSLAPQRGEGWRVRGEAMVGTPRLAIPYLVHTPHPTLSPLRGQGDMDWPHFEGASAGSNRAEALAGQAKCRPTL